MESRGCFFCLLRLFVLPIKYRFLLFFLKMFKTTTNRNRSMMHHLDRMKTTICLLFTASDFDIITWSSIYSSTCILRFVNNAKCVCCLLRKTSTALIPKDRIYDYMNLSLRFNKLEEHARRKRRRCKNFVPRRATTITKGRYQLEINCDMIYTLYHFLCIVPFHCIHVHPRGWTILFLPFISNIIDVLYYLLLQQKDDSIE